MIAGTPGTPGSQEGGEDSRDKVWGGSSKDPFSHPSTPSSQPNTPQTPQTPTTPLTPTSHATDPFAGLVAATSRASDPFAQQPLPVRSAAATAQVMGPGFGQVVMRPPGHPMGQMPGQERFAKPAPPPRLSMAQATDPFGQQSDPYAQPPGTPRPTQMPDPYGLGTALPQSSPLVHVRRDPFSQGPTPAPRPSDDPYAVQPATPRPVMGPQDPFMHQLRPQQPTVSQYPTVEPPRLSDPPQPRLTDPFTAGGPPPPLHSPVSQSTADPFAHPPGTPCSAPHDPYAQAPATPRPLVAESFAPSALVPRPAGSQESSLHPDLQHIITGSRSKFMSEHLAAQARDASGMVSSNWAGLGLRIMLLWRHFNQYGLESK